MCPFTGNCDAPEWNWWYHAITIEIFLPQGWLWLLPRNANHKSWKRNTQTESLTWEDAALGCWGNYSAHLVEIKNEEQQAFLRWALGLDNPLWPTFWNNFSRTILSLFPDDSVYGWWIGATDLNRCHPRYHILEITFIEALRRRALLPLVHTITYSRDLAISVKS